MKLNEIIEVAKDWRTWVLEHTNDTKVPNETRKKIGLAILQQSLDVGDSISLLMKANLPGPAFALGRPLIESYVRGVWLLNYASDEQIEKFMKGKCPHFSTLKNYIENDPDTVGAWIHAVMDKNLKSFHDLTHGGIEHAIRRVTEDSIEPNYPQEECVRLMRLQIEAQVNISTILLNMQQNEEGLKQLYEKTRHYLSIP